MTEPWWTAPLLIVLGAALSLGGQVLYHRASIARRRQVIAVALEEEIRGVAFSGNSFGGFSSLAFDQVLSEAADVLPPDVARTVLRYYFRMKYLQDWISNPAKYGGKPPGSGDIQEMSKQRDELMASLRSLAP